MQLGITETVKKTISRYFLNMLQPPVVRGQGVRPTGPLFRPDDFASCGSLAVPVKLDRKSEPVSRSRKAILPSASSRVGFSFLKELGRGMGYYGLEMRLNKGWGLN